MDLELAVAESCGATSCRVRSLSGSVLDARYAALVQDRIKVRPGDLVAVNRAAQPPEVVWRWWHGRIERVEGDRAEVSRNHTQPTMAHSRRRTEAMAVAPELAGHLRVGDTVFFGPEPVGVLDVAREGMPTHPERLRVLLPEVVSAYHRVPPA